MKISVIIPCRQTSSKWQRGCFSSRVDSNGNEPCCLLYSIPTPFRRSLSSAMIIYYKLSGFIWMSGNGSLSVLTGYAILRGLRGKGAARQDLAFDALCRLSQVLPPTEPIAVSAAGLWLKQVEGLRGTLSTDSGSGLNGFKKIKQGKPLLRNNNPFNPLQKSVDSTSPATRLPAHLDAPRISA